MAFLLDFYERRSQAKSYLKAFYESDAIRNSTPHKTVEQRNILKGGAFLVLYNLVEAAARTSVQAIHDQIEQDQVPFEDLKDKLRQYVVFSFKKYANPKQHTVMTNLSVDAVRSLNVDDHFSGNVDAKRLREILDIYGVSTTTDTLRTLNGSDLLTIKTNRNDLAHGNKTYEEVGRAYSDQDLLLIGIRSTRYVSQILRNVEVYLTSGDYLR